MLRLQRPRPESIQQLLKLHADVALSYADVGGTLRNELPDGFNRLDRSFRLGRGQACFERATEALGRWSCFNLPWIHLVTNGSPGTGRGLALVVRLFGFWSVNCCRVVAWDPGLSNLRRWNLVVGTTSHHMVSGEELVSVEWSDDDDVIFRIQSFSRPQIRIARLGWRLLRRRQLQFGNDSKDAMMRYMRASRKQPASRRRATVLHAAGD